MKYSPQYFNEIKKRYPAVADCFDELGRDCAKAGPLDKKTQHLVKLGVAVGEDVLEPARNSVEKVFTLA